MKFTKRLLVFVLVAVMLSSVLALFPVAKSGDLDGSGDIDYIDYMMVRRYCMGTLDLTPAQLKTADVDRSGGVDYLDYMMIRRHCLGTITIQNFAIPEGDAVTVEDGVTYQYYTINSDFADRTETAVALEFDPADGYIPMAFSCYSGTSGVLSTQYSKAVAKYGYDVVGVINGAFFSTDTSGLGNYGTLNGIVISNGKIASAHSGLVDSVVAFGTDGSMNIVNSALDYKLYINGEELNDAIHYINKTSGSNYASQWNNKFYYYDTSCGRVCDTFEICPGYEVICEKQENSDLAVGTTLIGKVLEVKENSYGAALAEGTNDLSDKFVLFVKTASPYASYVKDLKAGDSINIAVNETIKNSKEIMENANSVISNVGWLVKDGVDQTEIKSTIGSHSVLLAARWTAFGQKADGSYVFFTSEGGSTGDSTRSITLRDVAKFMMEQGCVNVIRMDGGGSSAMYVKNTGNGSAGYVQSSSRSVGDCILVVKKSSLVDEDLVDALEAKIAEAAPFIENSSVKAVVDEAKALIDAGNVVSGDAKRLIANISAALTGKDALNDILAECAGINYKEYSEANLTLIREAYAEAVALFGDPNAAADDIFAICNELEALIATNGEGELVGDGAAYLTGFNSKILAGDTTIFTNEFGTITADSANHRWTTNIILTWNEVAGAYVIDSVAVPTNGVVDDIDLADNQIMIACHNDPSVPESAGNAEICKNAKAGQKMVVYGIDLANRSKGVAAYFTFVD